MSASAETPTPHKHLTWDRWLRLLVENVFLGGILGLWALFFFEALWPHHWSRNQALSLCLLYFPLPLLLLDARRRRQHRPEQAAPPSHPVPHWMAVVLALGMFGIWSGIYYFTGWLTSSRAMLTLNTPIDHAIPLWTPSSFVYVTVQWFMVWAILQFADYVPWKRMYAAYITIVLTCALCFLTIPVTMHHPKVPVVDLSTWVLSLIRGADVGANNCFPSSHCAMALLSAFFLFRKSKTLGWIGVCSAFSIGLSTITTKQHYFADVVVGFALACASYYLWFVYKEGRWLGRLVAVAGLALLVGLAGCQSLQARDDDDWMAVAERKASPREKAYREKAMMALGRGDSKGETAAWQGLLAAFPRGYYAGLAHLRLGLKAYRKKAWKRAEGHFAKTHKHTLSSQERAHILFKHARCLLHLKRYPALEKLLLARLKQLSVPRKRTALKLLIQSAEERKQPKRAFGWRMALLKLASGPNQSQLRGRLIAYIKTLKGPQLQAFLRHADGQKYRFPLDYMALQQARLLYKRDQFKRAKALLSKLNRHLGIAHPLYKQAQRFLAEVKEVRRPADPLVLGAILPLSGKGVRIGLLMKNAIEVAILHHPQVRVIFKDSRSLPSIAARAVDVLVRQHKAIAIFGPPLPREAVAAATRAQKIGVPLISITAREKFSDIGDFIFRNNLTLSMMGAAVARYGFNHLRIKRFGVLYAANNYGRIQAQAFLNELRRLGAKLTSAIEYDPNTNDYQIYVKLLLGTTYANAHLLRLSRKHMKGLQAFQKRRLRKKVAKMLNPLVPFEGLFIPEQAKITSQIAAYLAYFNVGLKRVNLGQTPMFFSPRMRFRRIQLLGNNNWFHKDLFQAGNKYVRGGLFCVRFYPGSYRNANQHFVQSYHRMFRKKPIHITAFAYDAMRLLAHVSASGKVRTRPQFRRALLKIKGFKGPTGPIRIRPNGDAVGPIHFVLAYKGQFRIHGTLK